MVGVWVGIRRWGAFWFLVSKQFATFLHISSNLIRTKLFFFSSPGLVSVLLALLGKGFEFVLVR